ncbi:PAS domain-containing sensor histidine kinase [Pseudoxanthomonas koreensis]|uniref:sensor histidine kinase n=1 Tax=Pseudoxanthomonas koreensis TaxID=266061 RepID=UPI0035A62F65
MPHASLIQRIESIPTRELYFFALYRVLEAGLVAALVFSPLSEMVGSPRSAALGGTVAVVYLLASLALLAVSRNERWLVPLVFSGTCLDILAATLATHALPSVGAGIAMMLLFNVAAAAMLLPLRYALTVAVLASVAMVAEFVWSVLGGGASPRSLAELSMFITSYLALAWLGNQIGQRARSSQQLAARRTAEVASLVEINELIIRRMRTGVLVVDADQQITLANEAAALLLGEATSAGGTSLAAVVPELARRLQRWRNGWDVDDTPMQLQPDHPEVQPRFARLLADSDVVLVFLDDATVVSRRAESLTLATLGRFSASLAHEIRNPLAAINYAVQLLEESRTIDDTERRLLQIIHQQCQRTNGIVESVLGLARRERAKPENIELAGFVRRFVDEYRQTLAIETDSLEAVLPPHPVAAMADPRHLQQILTTLVHNALKYGRVMEEPARVRLRVFQAGRNALVDVLDRGPGIPEGVVVQLFRPFFTTSEHGTGLGLYIARELSRANQATLEYVSVPGGGACFRLALPGPHNMLPE